MSHNAGPILAASPGPPLRPAARISGRSVTRQMIMDSVANWAAGIGVTVAVFLSMLGNTPAASLCVPLMVGVLLLLGLMSYASFRATRELPLLAMRLEQDPAGTEARIAALIGHLPMHRSIRAQLYYRLAMLRYRQQRFAETVELCQALLARRLGKAAPVRPDLLLMLVDASLRRGDLNEAYLGLGELRSSRLRLGDHIQRLALETRYEVAAGYDRMALAGVARKLELCELLPVAQYAGTLLVLAVAARRVAQPVLAEWLESRARLLGAPPEAGGA